MPLVKAMIINTSTGEPIPVMFNPEEYAISKSATIAKIEIPGLESPILEFINGGQETLTMDLFFDTYELGIDVRVFTERISSLLDSIDPKRDEPPVLLFAWASLNFRCVLESLTKRFTMFSSLGMPVRATLSVTFHSYDTIEHHLARNPFRSLGHTKTYVVKEGETLSQIAWQVYQNPAAWRLIADQNRIENTRKLEPGQVLLIPPLDERG